MAAVAAIASSSTSASFLLLKQSRQRLSQQQHRQRDLLHKSTLAIRNRQRRPLSSLASPLRAAPVDGPVVSLGEGLFDLLADQKGLPRDKVTSWTPFPGGAPANVACAVSTLGRRAAFLSALGKDALGDDFISVLESKRVDVSGVQRVAGAPTRDVYVVYNASGDREFVGFGEGTPTEGYADCFVDAGSLPRATIESAGALITGTLGLAYPKTAEAMRAAVSLARRAGVPVVVDVNWRPVFFAEPESEETKETIRRYVSDSADVVKLSDEEAEWLFGVRAADALSDPEEVLRRLLGGGSGGGSGGGGAPAPASVAIGVLVTGGGAGAAYSFLGPEGKSATSGFVPALPVEATDTTGAGDAFLGGFVVAALDAGGIGALRSDAVTLRSAVEFAAAAGAATTTAPGAIAAQPSRDAVEALLKKK